MASFDYELSFAGVPFCLDQAQVVRVDSPPFQFHKEDENQQPVRRHQPMADLVDELNRIIPFTYLNDFALPEHYTGRNLAGIARLSTIGPMPDPTVKIGDWYYPNSASRWGVFRGLMPSSHVKEVLRLTGCANPATFVMKAPPYSIQRPELERVATSMYMLPPRPLAELGGKFDGLYLITLVDERYYWQFGGVTIHVNKDTTWRSMIEVLSQELGFTIEGTSAAMEQHPEPDSQFWVNQESSAVLMDAIAANLGGVWVRNFAKQYNIYQPIFSRSIVYGNRGNVNIVVRTAGGDLFSSGEQIPAGNLNASRNAVIPNAVSVTFPKYIKGDDPVPHFVNPRYQNQRPSAWYEDSYGDVYIVEVPLLSGAMQFSGQLGVYISGSAQLRNGIPFISSGLIGTSGYTQTFKSTAKALYDTESSAVSGGAPVNSSGLTSLAMQLAADYWNFQIDAALDEVIPGTFAWEPEGIHDIIWTYSARAGRATTRIMRSQWNLTVDDTQHAAVALSGSSHVQRGVGGPSVAQTIRDSFSGSIATTIVGNLLSGVNSLILSDESYFPTQNRWKALIDSERMLMEGTSGGVSVNIVYRGIDGTLVADHANGSVLSWLAPDAGYGVNLITYEKMQFIAPSDCTSGGIQGVNIIPQTQTVFVFSASGDTLNETYHYSGAVDIYDATFNSGFQFIRRENVWVVNRNGEGLRSGKRYDGQFAGYSPTPARPVYLINSRRVVVDVICTEDGGLQVTYGYT